MNYNNLYHNLGLLDYLKLTKSFQKIITLEEYLNDLNIE